MELVIIVLLIIAVIGLGVSLAYANYQTQDFKIKIAENEREKIENENEIEELEAELIQLNHRNRTLARDHDMMVIQVNLTTEEKNKLQSELEYLRPEYFRLKETISVNAVKNDSKESLEAELENLKALAVEKMSELEQISANTKLLSELQEEKIREIGELDSGIKALEGRICDGKKVLENIESQIVVTNNQLTELNVLKGAVLAVESGEGSVWEFKVPSDKSRLVELIHQLVDEYGNAFPILRKELLKVEWSSVWLPQVQQLCSREKLDRSGIYRLTLKSNSDVVYIGQAQSIKDR